MTDIYCAATCTNMNRKIATNWTLRRADLMRLLTGASMVVLLVLGLSGAPVQTGPDLAAHLAPIGDTSR